MKDSYPASKLSYLGERSEPRENARASRERPRKGEPQMMSHKFSIVTSPRRREIPLAENDVPDIKVD